MITMTSYSFRRVEFSSCVRVFSAEWSKSLCRKCRRGVCEPRGGGRVEVVYVGCSDWGLEWMLSIA